MGREGEFTWQAWAWPAGLIPRGTCHPLPLLRAQRRDEATRPCNIGVCENRSRVRDRQPSATIALSTRWSRLDVKLDQSGAISLGRCIYLEITHFILLPTEVAGRDVPWLVCYPFFNKARPRHVSNNRSAASSVLRALKVQLCSFA